MEQLRKLYWPLGVGLLCLALAIALGGNVGGIIFKFLAFCPAIMLIHFLRLKLLPYVDMSDMYAKSGTPERCVWIGGMFYLYCKMTETLVRAF
jgi:hypothetical protein